jgi:flagellar M-ring protein FliF
MREEQDRNRMVMGVPGTLSNRPPPANPNPADAAKPATDPAGLPEGTARKNATTRQYAYDRSITQTKRSRGRLEKLSVAVVLAQAPHRSRKPAGPPPKSPTSTRSCATAWASTPSAATAGGVLAELPAPAAVSPWWEEARQHRRHDRLRCYALGALLGYFAGAAPA